MHRWVVEQSIALLHWFRRLRIRWEIRDDIHEAFLSLACHRLLASPDEPLIVLGVPSRPAALCSAALIQYGQVRQYLPSDRAD